MPRESGPVAVMLHEHEEGRRYTQAFRSAAEQMQAGDTGASADVVRNVFDYVNLMREHILKEDNVLFPMAGQLLSGTAMQDLSQSFELVIAAQETSGETAKYKALAQKLTQSLSA